jgi:hypothetical protein
MMEMSIGMKKFYRLLISILLIIASWILYARLITYISFGEFLVVELVVIGSGMLGHYIKKSLGLDDKEKK